MNCKLILMAQLLVGFSSIAEASDPARAAIGDHSLSESQESALADLANAGDGIAAMKLSDRYLYDQSGSRDQNLERALEWALISAENGNLKAEYNVFSLMFNDPKKSRQIRAMYWLKRAARHGDLDARAYLKECPKLDSVSSSGDACFGPGA